MLYKVTIGQDVYLGTADEVVHFMAKADGAPTSRKGGVAAFMRGIAARVAKRSKEAPPIDVSSPDAFLDSLAAAKLIRLEERRESSSERVDRKTALGDGPVSFGEKVSIEDLERDVLGDE
jgi:hypothetical protein